MLSYPIKSIVLSLGIKRPETETDHSPPSSAERNMWGSASTRHES